MESGQEEEIRDAENAENNFELRFTKF